MAFGGLMYRLDQLSLFWRYFATVSTGYWSYSSVLAAVFSELDDNVRYPKLDASKASFNSHSLQRPNAKSFVPSPGEYNPNIYAILPAMGDSGAHTKSVASSTESELMSVNAKVAANKGKMIESLLKSVTTVGLD